MRKYPLRFEWLECRKLLAGDETFAASVSLVTELQSIKALPTNDGNPLFHDFHDFNGDGHLDLLATRSFPAKLQIHLGNDVSFDDPIVENSSGNATIIDTNDDGIADVVSQHFDRIRILETRQTENTIEFVQHDIACTGCEIPVFVDLDQDGRSEMVTTSSSSAGGISESTVVLFKSNTTIGEIEFTRLADELPGSLLTIVDVNDDAMPDIATTTGVVTPDTTSRQELHINTNLGELQFDVASLSTAGQFRAVVDVTDDGAPDVLESPELDNSLTRIWVNDGGVFEETIETQSDNDGRDFVGIEVDVDGDGRYDWIVRGAFDDIELNTNVDVFSFSAPNELLFNFNAPPLLFDATLADVTGDGVDDLVTKSGWDAHLPWFNATSVVLGEADGTLGFHAVSIDDGSLAAIDPINRVVATHGRQVLNTFEFVDSPVFSRELSGIQSEVPVEPSLLPPAEFESWIILGDTALQFTLNLDGTLLLRFGTSELLRYKSPYQIQGVIQEDFTGDGIEDILAWSGTKLWTPPGPTDRPEMISPTSRFVSFRSENYQQPIIHDLDLQYVTNVDAADLDNDGDLDLTLSFPGGAADWKNLTIDIQDLIGDFDQDGVLATADIDLLCSEIQSHSNSADFDLSEDGIVNAIDLDQLVQNHIGSRMGDVNLDGHVDFADFLVLSGNFGRKDVGWSGGNFDCDDEVDFADFLELSKNFDAR